MQNNIKEKVTVLDTSILVDHPELVSQLSGKVVIPQVVIRELDGLKKSRSEHVAQGAREVSRILDRLSSYGNLAEGVRLPTGALLVIASDFVTIDDLDSDADNKIVGTAITFLKAGADVILYSTDTNMRAVARLHGMKAEYAPIREELLEHSKTNARETTVVKSKYTIRDFIVIGISIACLTFVGLGLMLPSYIALWWSMALVLFIVLWFIPRSNFESRPGRDSIYPNSARGMSLDSFRPDWDHIGLENRSASANLLDD